MISQRAAQQSLRRLAVQQPYAMRWSMMNSVSPAAVATGRAMQLRPMITNTSDPSKLLPQQRLNRPVSPHLTIYRPQVTWYLSAFNRITGAALSGPLYLFSMAYLAAPMLGWHLDSASLVTAFATLPIVAKILLKATVAFPFAFHSFNGVRHLVWDLGRGFTNQQVIKSAWTVVGLSVVSALYLAFI